MISNIKIVGVGSPLVDSLMSVTEDFLADVSGEKGGMELVDIEMIEDLVQQGTDDVVNASGGSAANTIVGLSKLGISCSFLGKLGKDDQGQFYVNEFKAAGVNTDRFKYCDQSPTGRCLSMITPDSQRTCRTYLGAAMNLSPHEVSAEDFAGFTHVHIEGYKLFNRDLIIQILKSAKEAGTKISLDLASFEVVRDNMDVLEQILVEYVDIVFANEDEARAFCGSDDPLVGLHKLAEHCEVAAVKVGPEGAFIKCGDEVVKVDSHAVEALDTTGAGDLWASGFLFGHGKGLDLKSCGMIGSLLGSTVVQQIGALIPSEEWSNLEQRISEILS